MSLADPMVFVTENQDGSAVFTISVDEEDHKFSAAPDGSNASLIYDETCSWRGEIHTSEPRDDVWKMLMQSDEMTQYLESNDLTGVRRERQ